MDHHKTADDQVAFELCRSLQRPSEITNVVVVDAAAADCHDAAVTAACYQSAQLVFHHVNAAAPSFCHVTRHTICSLLATNLLKKTTELVHLLGMEFIV